MEINFSISEKELVEFHQKSLPGFDIPSLQRMGDDTELACDVRTGENPANDNAAEPQENISNAALGNTDSSAALETGQKAFSPGASSFFMQRSLVDYSRFGSGDAQNGLPSNLLNFDSYFKRRKMPGKNGKKKKNRTSKKKQKSPKQKGQTSNVS